MTFLYMPATQILHSDFHVEIYSIYKLVKGTVHPKYLPF